MSSDPLFTSSRATKILSLVVLAVRLHGGQQDIKNGGVEYSTPPR